MHYGQIFDCDTGNGPGIRITLFVSGCTHHCKGCFNEETWNFQYGMPFTVETESSILSMLDKEYVAGLTLLGGEPMEPQNQETLAPFLRRVKARFPNKPIWVYSGYLWEQLTSDAHPHCIVTDDILDSVDVIVDGRFIVDKKDIRLKFRGSSNQRVLDVQASRKSGQACWLSGYEAPI